MSAIDPGTVPRSPRRGPAWVAAVIAVVVVLVGGAVAGVLWATRNVTPVANGSSPAVSVSATSTGQPSTAQSSSGVSSQQPSASTVPASVVRAIPVYYLADMAGGPRLYREFHSLPVLGGGPALTAVTEMLQGAPVDPDYRSPWPTSTRVRSLTVSGDLATVDLTGFVALGAAYESAAVQQLVWTVTAAEPSVHRVRLLVNGGLPPSGHMVWSDPVSRQNALEIQAYVWILGPTQGATVGSPVTVSVLGTGYEGNVPLKIYQGGTLVASRSVVTMMGGFAEARTTFTLPPGTYEVRAYNDNGRDDTLQLWDTKTFTVQ